MLLDKYVLTKAFEGLLSYHHDHSVPLSTNTPYQPPPSFVKRINQIMSRIDPLLKTLQVRPSPPEGLVQAYLIHISDRSEANFRKILDLKGVRKQDQPHLVELFTIHRDSAANNDRPLVQSSPLTPLLSASSTFPSAGGGGGLGAGGGAAGGTGSPLVPGAVGGRFDAASLGEKLLNAARDGVERIGTTGAVGVGGGVGGSTGLGVSGLTEKATINENLKNIGNFFRRDIGGLGARFGKRDITPTGLDDSQR
jgi:hypothetical protein